MPINLLSRPTYPSLPSPSPQVPNSVSQQLPSAAGGASALCFSHSGVFLAAACGDPNGTFWVIVWNVLTGVAISKLHHAHNDYVYEMTFSPEDDALLTCSSDGTAKVTCGKLYDCSYFRYGRGRQSVGGKQVESPAFAHLFILPHLYLSGVGV